MAAHRLLPAKWDADGLQPHRSGHLPGETASGSDLPGLPLLPQPAGRDAGKYAALPAVYPGGAAGTLLRVKFPGADGENGLLVTDENRALICVGHQVRGKKYTTCPYYKGGKPKKK